MTNTTSNFEFTRQELARYIRRTKRNPIDAQRFLEDNAITLLKALDLAEYYDRKNK